MSWKITATSAPILWTPAAISTALWLDAADASTVTTVSGTVSQWNDKSGNGRNATPYRAAPTYNAIGFSGNGTIDFNGSNQDLQVNTFYQSDWYIIAVARTNSGTSNQTICSKYSGVNREFLFRITNANKLLGRINPVGSNSNLNSNVITTQSVGTNFGIFSFYKSGTTCALGINGTNEVNSFNTSTVYNGTIPFCIGSEGADLSNYLNGSIQQLVVTQGAPTDATMRKLEGWAAWSSGLQSLLPADHPYKSAAPTL